MSAPPWMLLRLGLETAAYHGPADEDRLRALTVRTADEYRALLARIFGFEAAVERLVLRMRHLDQSFIEDRLRSMYLREDLRSLGVGEHDVATAAVTIDSPAHALGWLFVIERHMLVSGLIRRQLAPLFADAVRYFSAYGDRPGARFRTFAGGLSQHAKRHDPKLIVAGAVDGFRMQRQWYRSAPTPPKQQDEPARAVG